MATITPEQRQEIENAGNEPVRLSDPQTHAEDVILKADVYERLKSLMEIDRSDRSLYESGDFHPLGS